MADSPLIIKSKEFALQIIRVCNYVKQSKGQGDGSIVSLPLVPDGIVYCNVHPLGLPEILWVNDFYATGEKLVTKISF